MSYRFRDQSWPQIQGHIEKQSLLILPVGTTEEHGPHLPVDSDSRIADAWGERLAEKLAPEMPLLLMDTIRYGYSLRIMKQWPGTIVVRSRVFMDMVFDICKSVLDMGFTKLALLDCHGQHSGMLSAVSRELCDACDKAVAIVGLGPMTADAFNAVRRSPQGGAMHSCEYETSILLHLCPDLVDMSRATDEDIMRYHSEFIAGDGFLGKQKVTWSTWYLQSSNTGVYGDPTCATAETGKIVMDAAVENSARFMREFWRWNGEEKYVQASDKELLVDTWRA